MKLSEPTTAITEFILGVELLVFAFLTLKSTNRQRSVFIWGLAFGSLAVSAVAGGIYHGLLNQAAFETLVSFWRLSMATIVATLGLMIAAGIISAFSRRLALILLFVAELVILYYLIHAATQPAPEIILKHSHLRMVAIFLALGLLYFHQVYSNGPESGRLILLGSMILFAGIWVQGVRLYVSANFNQNDLCHIIFMIGSFFLYRGGLLLRDHSTSLRQDQNV